MTKPEVIEKLADMIVGLREMMNDQKSVWNRSTYQYVGNAVEHLKTAYDLLDVKVSKKTDKTVPKISRDEQHDDMLDPILPYPAPTPSRMNMNPAMPNVPTRAQENTYMPASFDDFFHTDIPTRTTREG